MKAAIYCRLSEEDRGRQDADSMSIQNQKSMLLSYADSHNWEVYDIYSDDDYAGADRRRPAFNRMLADAEAHRFDVILCKTQSRFTREMELVEKYIHGLFPLWGIRFVSIVDNADTALPGNKKARQISGLVNEWYLEDMSENIRSVLTDRRRHGLHIGSHALYGYQKDPDRRGHLVIDPVAAAVVREIFTLYASGYGKTAIARQLNARAVPTPADYRSGRAGGLWQYGTIGAMLTNEMYIGNMVQGKYGSVSYKTKINKPRKRTEWICVEGTHEPIIPKALWDTVQSIVKTRAKPFTGGAIGVLTGLVRCAHCGSPMRTVQNRGRRYFQCRTRYLATEQCPGAFISSATLSEIVLHELTALRATVPETDVSPGNAYSLFADILLPDSDNSDNIAAQRRSVISSLDVQIAQLRRALTELYMDKVRGIVSETEYTELRETIRNEKDQLQKKLAQLEETDMAPVTDHEIPSPSDRLASYLSPTELCREMAVGMIEYITVAHRTDTGVVQIEIHWQF